MTIMVVGALTFAISGVMPSAQAATENLFVSAENSLFDNSFAGPMVIEVLINDPDLKEIDEAESEPDVTVNGQDLRMVQATDGNWYAYFAERTMAQRADATIDRFSNGHGLDFGYGCSADSAPGPGSQGYRDTEGVFFNGPVVGSSYGNDDLGDCTGGGYQTSLR